MQNKNKCGVEEVKLFFILIFCVSVFNFCWFVFIIVTTQQAIALTGASRPCNPRSDCVSVYDLKYPLGNYQYGRFKLRGSVYFVQVSGFCCILIVFLYKF